MPYLLLSDSFPVRAPYSGISRVRGCLESGWMSKGNKNERKKMDGLGQKMEESMMDDTLFRVSSVRGLSLAL